MSAPTYQQQQQRQPVILQHPASQSKRAPDPLRQPATRQKSRVQGYVATFIFGVIIGVTLQNGMLSQFFGFLAALTGGAK